MPIKRSADAGKAIERLLESENAQHEQLSFDLNISAQMVSHIKNNRRKMQQDIAKESIRLYDNPEYIMDILHEFSNGFTPPVFRGKHIDFHRLAMKANTQKHMEAVLLLLDESGLEKPPDALTSVEREAVRQLVDALLDSRAHSDNFLKQLQVEYRISLKERMKAALVKWKAVGWI